MTGIMWILGGEDRINCWEERVAASLLSPGENPELFE
jgi:hypothetical protein